MPNTKKIYTNFAQTRLERAISDSDLSCLITDESTQLFTGWESGAEFYLTLVDPSAHREIVKVTGISGKWLTVSRGQQSTTARSWPIGTLIEQRPTADDMSSLIQQEAFRTVTYRPHGVLTANYPGEKVYQTDAGDCKKRWWKNVSGSKWRLIAGTLCDGESYDEDGYVVPWVSYFDDTCWEPHFPDYGTWDGTKWVSGYSAGIYGFNLVPRGSWYQGYAPTKMRITFSGLPAVSMALLDTDANLLCDYPTCNYTSLLEASVAWFGLNIEHLNASTQGGCAQVNEWYITNIEFSEE